MCLNRNCQMGDISTSDSYSKIKRCNIRILIHPDISHVSSSSFEEEVTKTIEIGNSVVFIMIGKEKEVLSCINANGVFTCHQ